MKSTSIALLAFIGVSVSKELEFLANVGTIGHSYFPHASKFNHLLLTNETLEDYSVKNITPLGIRQHYLIGQELRRRYIENPSIGTEIPGYNYAFLNQSYRIQECFMRTSGNSESYTSAHAQMIGLYPPETCNQKLTEWQKKNVRPPLFEGVTQKEIDDIGDFATKGGFTPFDIFNQYPTEDQMNEYDGVGCERYSQLRQLALQSPEFNTIKLNLSQTVIPQIQNITQVILTTYEDAVELCQFIEDSWVDGYDFKTFQYTPELKSNCIKVLESQAYYKLFAHEYLPLLKVSEMVQLITARLYHLIDDKVLALDLNMTKEFDWLVNYHQYMMKFNNFNKLISFKIFMFVGESWNLKAFLSLITDEFKWDYVPPASILLIEGFEKTNVNNATGLPEYEGTIKVKYNDNLVSLKGRCAGKTECDAFEFIQSLREQGVYFMDKMVDVCQKNISANETFIFSNPQEFLEQVSRHGARAPGKIFPFAKDPSQNYEKTSELTALGKKQHYDLGLYLRRKYIQELKFLSPDYDEREIYVQTTYLSRTYLSGLYQLMGMFPDNQPSHFDYELYQIGNEDYLSQVQKQSNGCQQDNCTQKFLIHQVNATHDYLLHLDDENCPRFALVKDMLKDSEQFKVISNHILSSLEPKMRELTLWNNLTTAKLVINMCGYIQWSSYDNLPLSFEYDDNLLRHCSAAGDAKLFFKSYGLPEPWMLGAFEFLQQLQEFSRIVINKNDFDSEVFWSKYFKMHFHQNLDKQNKPIFPKFIHYASHAETLSLFYESLGLHRLVRADPGEALFIEYFRESEDGKVYVRFIQKNSQEIILKLIDEGEKVQIEEFIYYVDERLGIHKKERYDKDYIENHCEDLNFTFDSSQVTDPNQVIADLINFYQLQQLELLDLENGSKNQCNEDL